MTTTLQDRIKAQVREGGRITFAAFMAMALYEPAGGYYATGDVTFQPQFDVLADGQGRQPGSAIKPLNYITGIDDGTMTAATMLMDVTTDFGCQKPFTPTQADRL